MATNVKATRTVKGREVPPAGVWTVDTAHSAIRFMVRHMGIAKVRGHFRAFSGTIVINDDPTLSWAEASIQAASIDTGDRDRDDHLRSADFLDVERFPEIHYRSTSVDLGRDDHWEVTGELAIRDVIRECVMDVEFSGAAVDPWGNLRAGFVGLTEINREDFLITWNQTLETGGFLVSKEIKIEVEVEAVRQADTGAES